MQIIEKTMVMCVQLVRQLSSVCHRRVWLMYVLPGEDLTAYLMLFQPVMLTFAVVIEKLCIHLALPC